MLLLIIKINDAFYIYTVVNKIRHNAMMYCTYFIQNILQLTLSLQLINYLTFKRLNFQYTIYLNSPQ